jgi:hypothetical protein
VKDFRSSAGEFSENVLQEDSRWIILLPQGPIYCSFIAGDEIKFENAAKYDNH